MISFSSQRNQSTDLTDDTLRATHNFVYTVVGRSVERATNSSYKIGAGAQQTGDGATKLYSGRLRDSTYTSFGVQKDTRHGKGKGKVFPYSLPSVGPGADPGVQAVSPQVT